MKPIIGITPSPSEDQFSHGLFYRYALSSNYSEAIEAAGGVPLIIPPQHGNIEEILSTVDGLLLSGGGDLNPQRYGDNSVHETTYGIHELRDELEIELTKGAIARDLPVFCICRGIQVLNVALGGTLYQDIADQYSDQIQHRQHENGIQASEPSHEVTAVRDSLLGDVYGAESIQTNSFHHQGLKEVSPELRTVGTAPDGVVEAVERPASTWMLGVQWHPEMMFKAHGEHLKPFVGLVKAATVYHEKTARETMAVHD
jgi:putative glutamine amidotransferase